MGRYHLSGRHIGILLTARCNLMCTHCLQPRHFAHDIDYDLCVRIVREAAELDIHRISFSGGEPTMYPRFVDLVKVVREARINYSVTTNGLILKPLLKAALVQRPAHITISLDGIDAASHDYVRGFGNFERVKRNAYLLAAAGLTLRFQCTLVKPLIDHLSMLPGLVESMGGSELVLVLPIPTDELVNTNRFPKTEEFINAKRWINSQALKRQGVPIVLALGDQILTDADLDKHIPSCSYLKGDQYFVDWDGRLCLCCQMSAVSSKSSDVVSDLRNISLTEAMDRRSVWLKDFSISRMEHKSPYGCLTCAASLGKQPCPTMSACF